MPVILKHRTMTPPLYIGEGGIVSDPERALQFPSFIDAESHLSYLDIPTLLYTATEVPVTASRKIRKTVRWKTVAEGAQGRIAALEAEARLTQERLHAEAERATAESLRADNYRKAHRKAMEAVVAITLLWVTSFIVLFWVQGR